ncbi:MAG: hypothetical protein K0R84_2341 [Clostridia bacterium]|nr:hypothetical protein [Clostridia bacterium]
MKKVYENIIFIGFISFFIGSLLLVFGQFIGFTINNPNFILSAEKITKFIFPAAAISGLLCFLHPYIFRKAGKV